LKHEVLIGQTDYTVLAKIRDTAGAAATGLDEADIDIAYARVETDNDVATTDVTPAALSALTDAHTDWGFEEVSATDHPGLYRLDIADAVFAAGAWSAVVTITGTGLDSCDLEFVLIAFNPRDGVRLGLTALPSSAVEADGPVPLFGITDQGTAQSATSTTLVLRAAAPFADNTCIGSTLLVFGSTQGYWQARQITDYTTADDTATVDAWDVTPSGTITYKVFGSPPGSTSSPPAVNVTQIVGSSDAATRFDRAARCIVTGTVGSGSTTTAIVCSAVSPSAGTNAWAGRVVIFDATTTTADLRGQVGVIESNTSGATPTITLTALTALTDAPVSTDTFVIQ
jgi:hypothetical protein